MNSPELPRHTRPVPPAWPGLVELSQAAIDEFSDTGKISAEASDVVLEAIKSLDNETLERNRYYGLGHISSHFIQFLSNPMERAAVVDETASVIASNSKESTRAVGVDATPGIKIQDLATPLIIEPLSRRVAPVSAQVQASHRLLTDSLQIASDRRINDLEMIHDQLLHATYDGSTSPATANVANNLLGGARSSYSLAIRLYIARNHPEFPINSGMSSSMVISHELTEQQLRAIRVARIAVPGAKLRLDEFNYGFHNWVYLEDDQPRLENVPLEPTPLDDYFDRYGHVRLHDERLRCPALNVSQAIPFALDLMADIIVAAQAIEDPPRRRKR